LLFLGLGDVGTGTNPLQYVAFRGENGHPAAGHGAPGAIVATDAELILVGLPPRQALVPALRDAVAVVGVDGTQPTFALDRFLVLTRERLPAGKVGRDRALRVGGPQNVRQGAHQSAVAALAGVQQGLA